MGMLSSIGAATAPLPIARISALPTGPTLSVVPATEAINTVVAVMPVQAKTAGGAVAPELPQSTAARILVQNADGIELDNIPFTNDGAILLDDLPMPEKAELPPEPVVEPEPEPEPEPEQAKAPDLGLVATRGYLASREAAAPQEPEAKPAPDPESEPLFGSRD